MAETKAPGVVTLLVGTYTSKKGHVEGQGTGIHQCTINTATGAFASAGEPFPYQNPTWISRSRNSKILFSCGEDMSFRGQASGHAASFQLGGTDGITSMRSQTAAIGTDTCHCEEHENGRFVAFANYTSGSVTILPVRPDGSLGSPSGFSQHGEGHTFPGPVPSRQEQAHAHQCRFHPTAINSLYVPDLGMDQIVQYAFNPATGGITRVDAAEAPAGCGPRHLDWHPSGAFCYVAFELACEVGIFSVDSDTGALTFLESLSTFASPEDKISDSTASQILVHPSGELIFIATRGADLISTFRIVDGGASLTLVSTTSTGGRTPRHFTFIDEGRLLLCANQDSSNLCSFRVEASGELQALDKLDLPTPACIMQLN